MFLGVQGSENVLSFGRKTVVSGDTLNQTI